MPLNSYGTLGRSGLRVSPFCLGAMTFGEDWGWGATPEDSAKILGTFLERGGNFVDTANFYTKGHSEKIIGDFIAQDRGRRERMVLATKFFCNLNPGDPNHRSAHHEAASFEPCCPAAASFGRPRRAPRQAVRTSAQLSCSVYASHSQLLACQCDGKRHRINALAACPKGP
jgi:aryl-alcohol dehydrogenase-like predicted oxidoreductase